MTPTRTSALRVSSTGQVIDTNPSLGEIYASVDTACRLRPSGTVNVSQPSKPLPERTGQQRKLLTPCFVQAKDEDMRDFRDAKAMANTLRAALAAKGFKITISQSLELIAEALGVADWNTLSAAIRAEA